MDQPILVLTTVADAVQAREIAHQLIEARLVACVQMLPVESVYRWQGKVLENQEIRLECKTIRRRYEELVTVLRKIHPYEVPAIEVLDLVEVEPHFASWICENTSGFML